MGGRGMVLPHSVDSTDDSDKDDINDKPNINDKPVPSVILQ